MRENHLSCLPETEEFSSIHATKLIRRERDEKDEKGTQKILPHVRDSVHMKR